MLYNDSVDKETNAFRKFAEDSSKYSRQMTEAWLKMVESGQYPIPDEAMRDISKAKSHVVEYFTAYKNWRSLKIFS